MSNLPQLFMRKPALDDLPELSAKAGKLPDGLSIHTHINGEEDNWERLIEKSFGCHYGFESNLPAMPKYDPSCVFYISRNGEDIAVAAGVENKSFPNEGWLHFVGIDPSAQGLGLSKHIVLTVLYSFYARGYKSAVLSTDDFRIPAIKTYLRLGFEPIISHESHPERWREVMSKIK